MIGIYSDKLVNANHFQDDSVFYFQTTIFYKRRIEINGTLVPHYSKQTHPCVPCTVDHFEIDSFPIYLRGESLKQLFCIDYKSFKALNVSVRYTDDIDFSAIKIDMKRCDSDPQRVLRNEC